MADYIYTIFLDAGHGLQLSIPPSIPPAVQRTRVEKKRVSIPFMP